MAASSSVSKSERSYIQASLHSSPPLRADGRSLAHYRTVFLETGVAPLGNGSARVSIVKSLQEGGGGTEVIAAVKLEVEDIELGEGVDGGRIVCTVSWCVSTVHAVCVFLVFDECKDSSPSAYPHLSPNALDDLQYDHTVVLHQTLSHPSLHPNNLGILPKKKAWLLSLDVTVLSDAGNIYDVLFMAARAALWDTRVPRTRGVQYSARKASGGRDEKMVVEEGMESSGFDTRQMPTATDFELPDSWDDGEVLGGREQWPVCITLNVVSLVFTSTQQLSAKSTKGSTRTLFGCYAFGRSFYTSAPTPYVLISTIKTTQRASHETSRTW